MSFLVFRSEMNLLLVPSLLVDEFVMNSPVYWQNDDKSALGNVDCVSSLLPPLSFRGRFRGFVVQVVADGDLLGYPIYLVRFAPVAPFSSSAVG